ncbi:MAG: hypothetical protein U0531_13840 [Dehalococcoidia bacterium]
MSTALQQAAIVGVYESKQARALNRTAVDLYFEVVKGALDDAGLSIKDVDGVIGENPLVTEGEGRGLPASAFAEYFGTHLRYAAQALTARRPTRSASSTRWRRWRSAAHGRGGDGLGSFRLRRAGWRLRPGRER